MSARTRKVISTAIVAVLVIGLWIWQSRSSDPEVTAPAGDTIAYGQLPREAKETIRLIETGGPFPYRRDGVTFGNFEGLLPKHPRGFYREYTVAPPGSTTGSANRGARRIVAGRDQTLYYTADHYQSFRKVIR